jgi:hypothetical protein
MENRVLDIGGRAYLTQHKSGNGRGLSTGKLLPRDWQLLEIQVVSRDDNKLVIQIVPMSKEK